MILCIVNLQKQQIQPGNVTGCTVECSSEVTGSVIDEIKTIYVRETEALVEESRRWSPRFTSEAI